MKRLLDLTISIPLLLMMSPVFVLISIILKVQIGSPIFFTQERPGLNDEPFYLYKFRTMSNRTDEQGNLLSDEKRLTEVGAILRKYSLDEFPQLINVIKGDMSLVGPRPLLLEYLPLYTPEQSLRNLVKPGITGWAQINGRNAITWEEKFRCDTWYVKNWSLGLDIKILALTFSKVLKKEGISHQNQVTMEKFKGSKEVM
ncbi:sugar transferase [Halobacillus halophilus]|uniref:Undecaprenyl-phosphate galactose phosphotransferase n=1 Tax=Halobacillus halophilus (strain ATCC 35676 / DSM 2266 / JCM 20832 / KCTC 3685 / LMG 17431 / NBRC 102448 / NCIMB 2269) TaxID=866895 RepID=I0JJL3_HALH3|nr:sugar transferase [Halobacillus halophilus]ASF41448.1 sugar transferase [Halobacillus halophilus]CCG44331.1 undecaprenyl-phosphate galactose phosphotransferase [Halobacillus halophilus DSM 2266]